MAPFCVSWHWRVAMTVAWQMCYSKVCLLLVSLPKFGVLQTGRFPVL